MLYLHTEDMVGPEIHDFPLGDQLTVENSSRERALVVQRLDTGLLTVRLRVRFPTNSVGAHC